MERAVPRGARAVEVALRELTQGPTRIERRRGIRTALPEGREAQVAAGRRGELVRELLRSTLAARLSGDEADASLADRGDARSARAEGAGGARDRGPRRHNSSARHAPRRVARGYGRERLRVFDPRRPAPPRRARILDRRDVTDETDYLTEQALLAFQGWEDLDRTGTVTGQTQLALFRAQRPRPAARRRGRPSRDLPRPRRSPRWSRTARSRASCTRRPEPVTYTGR